MGGQRSQGLGAQMPGFYPVSGKGVGCVGELEQRGGGLDAWVLWDGSGGCCDGARMPGFPRTGVGSGGYNLGSGTLDTWVLS